MRAFLILLLIGLAAPALAAPIPYGDFVGLTVTYVDVREDSVTDPGGLFGEPTISGDVLNFDPVGFGASATGAGGIDITDGNLAFMVVANENQIIEEFNLTEAGDYTIFGAGGIGTRATVRTPVFLEIVEVDGVSINPIDLQLQMIFTPSGGTYDLANDGEGFGEIWNGSLNVDLTQVLIDNGIVFTDGVTKINVNLDNILTAQSESGTSATIAKKDFRGLSVTVPEPSTVVLLSIGLVGLAWKGRRV